MLVGAFGKQISKNVIEVLKQEKVGPLYIGVVETNKIVILFKCNAVELCFWLLIPIQSSLYCAQIHVMSLSLFLN